MHKTLDLETINQKAWGLNTHEGPKWAQDDDDDDDEVPLLDPQLKHLFLILFLHPQATKCTQKAKNHQGNKVRVFLRFEGDGGW